MNERIRSLRLVLSDTEVVSFAFEKISPKVPAEPVTLCIYVPCITTPETGGPGPKPFTGWVMGPRGTPAY